MYRLESSVIIGSYASFNIHRIACGRFSIPVRYASRSPDDVRFHHFIPTNFQALWLKYSEFLNSQEIKFRLESSSFDDILDYYSSHSLLEFDKNQELAHSEIIKKNVPSINIEKIVKKKTYQIVQVDNFLENKPEKLDFNLFPNSLFIGDSSFVTDANDFSFV